MDPLRFLKSTDQLERDVIIEIVELFEERREQHERNLAIQIANQVGKVFGGK